MKALAINTGSSTLKFKLFELPSEKVLISGNFKNYEENKYDLELIAESRSLVALNERDYIYNIDYLFKLLEEKKLIKNPSEIEFIVHRIVHGGEEFKEPVLLDDNIIEKISKYNQFAPLHNPFAIEKITQIKKTFSNIKQYAVFDTTFHLSNSKEDFLYGLPFGYYENLRVRRYGFHGISHKFICEKINNPTHTPLKLREGAEGGGVKHISCHLGSGSSVCAILDGKSIDHSFGFTPNENLIMTTRAGEVDYDAVVFVKKKLGLDDSDVDKLINFESGFLGISGYTKDMKQLLKDYKTNDRAKLTIDMYINSIIKYISYFFVKLSGCDYLTFTGGIGAGSDVIREMIIKKLEVLGIKINYELNKDKIDVNETLDLSTNESTTRVFVIPTDEELEMIREITLQ